MKERHVSRSDSHRVRKEFSVAEFVEDVGVDGIVSDNGRVADWGAFHGSVENELGILD